MAQNKNYIITFLLTLTSHFAYCQTIRVTPFSLDDAIIYQKRTITKTANWAVEEFKINNVQSDHFDQWVKRMYSAEKITKTRLEKYKFPCYYAGTKKDVNRSPLTTPSHHFIRFKGGKIIWFLRVYPSSEDEEFRLSAGDLIEKARKGAWVSKTYGTGQPQAWANSHKDCR